MARTQTETTVASQDARRFGYGASGGAAELISAAQAARETFETLAEAQMALYALMRDGDERASAAYADLLTASSAAYDLWQLVERAAHPLVSAAARECLGYDLPAQRAEKALGMDGTL